MRLVQVLWRRGEFSTTIGKRHEQTRLRIGCHCGEGLSVNVPLKGVNKIECPHCELEYTINFRGDVYCHECQDKFNSSRLEAIDIAKARRLFTKQKGFKIR